MIDLNKYNEMAQKLNIRFCLIYSGPMWQDGIKGIANLLQMRLDIDDAFGSMAESIFSVFVEQITNVMMYSAGKKRFSQPDKEATDISTGTLIFGCKEQAYFIQTKNVVKNKSAELIKSRIDYLNTLDKKSLRQYYKEQLGADNDNPESQGAGLGLIEIARRATAPIEYKFEPIDERISNFTMYVEIGHKKNGRTNDAL